MVDFDALAEAMGDLDEDTMTEMLNEVMADGGSDPFEFICCHSHSNSSSAY